MPIPNTNPSQRRHDGPDLAMPPVQNFAPFEVMRPKYQHHVVPDAFVIGSKVFPAWGENYTLYLVEITFEEVKAYALLRDEKLRELFPRHVFRPGNVLDDAKKRWDRRGAAKYRRILHAAWNSPYGLCVAPPQWDIFELDNVEAKMKDSVLFDVVVFVEWDDGERSWELAYDSGGSGPELNLAGYLAEVGRRNEKEFRRLVKRHYLDTFGCRSNNVSADWVKGTPLWNLNTGRFDNASPKDFIGIQRG